MIKCRSWLSTNTRQSSNEYMYKGQTTTSNISDNQMQWVFHLEFSCLHASFYLSITCFRALLHSWRSDDTLLNSGGGNHPGLQPRWYFQVDFPIKSRVLSIFGFFHPVSLDWIIWPWCPLKVLCHLQKAKYRQIFLWSFRAPWHIQFADLLVGTRFNKVQKTWPKAFDLSLAHRIAIPIASR